MRLKVDENLPSEFAELLRKAGHDVATVREERLGGADDARVATACRDEGRGLITLDVGFSNIRRYPLGASPGIVVLRLEQQDKPHTLSVAGRLVSLLGREELAGRLWIVDERRVRIRRG
jgi:predicted nuclease of predicted toxin-antitoxin system